MKKSNRLIAATALLALGFLSGVHAGPTVILPTAPIDGITPQQFDQGLVYSSALLAQQQAAGLLPGNTSVFDFAVGSGTFDVIVYSNNGVANPAVFAEPMNAGGSGSFDGTWGIGQAGTVGAVRSLLTVGGINYQPMFVFDHNENQQNPNLQISGRVAIYRGNTQLASFAIDTTTNGSYDIDSRVTSCGSPYVGPAAPTPYGDCNIPVDTDTDTTYHWTTNGSGKPDYFAIFPAFDLFKTDFLDSDSLVVQMSLRNMDPGFDELAIAGYRLDNNRTTVPEPGSVALVGLALFFAANMTRRKVRGIAP